jgi:hypothetical protein
MSMKFCTTEEKPVDIEIVSGVTETDKVRNLQQQSI